ncbi:lysylphosphatidylglycerol synthase transmembrane domain-containing protein [Haloarcula brevis]|uniref:lysylphosphatidylglycerol synthase transmembrane domain-containing protein n=1 Tax=Haloarcula brevis TaxID=3111453 RepID=UPI00300EEFB4
MTSRARDVGITVAQYGLAVAALAWLLTQFDIGSAVDLLAGVESGTALAVVAVSALGICGRAYSWYAVVRPLAPVRFRTAAGTTLIVNFVNQLLPSRLSGRLAAPFVLRSQTGMAYSDAAAASALHTGIFALYYGVAATAGLVLAVPLLRVELLLLLALATSLYFAAGLTILLGGLNLSYLDRFIGWLSGAAARVPRVGEKLAARLDGLLAFTDSSTATFRRLAGEPGVWLRYAVGWTVDLVLAPGVRVGLLLGSFGVAFEPLVAVPLYLLVAYAVTLLPLTPGGIGVTEATATAVFVALGVPAEVVVPVVFVDRFLSIYLPSLAGWYPSVRLDVASLTTE